VIWATGIIIAGAGAWKALDIVVVAPAWLRKTVPPPLVTEISPTEPSASGSKEMLFACPSAAADPATLVPRIPNVATGVFKTIASGPVFAICPETNEKTP
jgi:hypothetical protein